MKFNLYWNEYHMQMSYSGFKCRLEEDFNENTQRGWWFWRCWYAGWLCINSKSRNNIKWKYTRKYKHIHSFEQRCSLSHVNTLFIWNENRSKHILSHILSLLEYLLHVISFLIWNMNFEIVKHFFFCIYGIRLYSFLSVSTWRQADERYITFFAVSSLRKKKKMFSLFFFAKSTLKYFLLRKEIPRYLFSILIIFFSWLFDCIPSLFWRLFLIKSIVEICQSINNSQ